MPAHNFHLTGEIPPSLPEFSLDEAFVYINETSDYIDETFVFIIKGFDYRIRQEILTNIPLFPQFYPLNSHTLHKYAP